MPGQNIVGQGCVPNGTSLRLIGAVSVTVSGTLVKEEQFTCAPGQTYTITETWIIDGAWTYENIGIGTIGDLQMSLRGNCCSKCRFDIQFETGVASDIGTIDKSIECDPGSCVGIVDCAGYPIETEAPLLTFFDEMHILPHPSFEEPGACKYQIRFVCVANFESDPIEADDLIDVHTIEVEVDDNGFVGTLTAEIEILAGA